MRYMFNILTKRNHSFNEDLCASVVKVRSIDNLLTKERTLREDISAEFNFADKRVKMGEFRGL